MIVFIIIAAALAAGCVTAIAVPLLGPMPAQAVRAPWAALASAVALVVGSVGLYAVWSNWLWPQSPGIASPEGMVERLVHQLNDHPDNLSGWLMLGRSYVALQEYPLAVRAYERADRVAGGRSIYPLLGEANTLELMGEPALDNEAGQLIERALAIEPSSPQALFFGAAAAMRRDDLPLARVRFARLLALNPPAKVKAILEQEISAIDRTLALGTGAPPDSGAPSPSPKTP